MGYSAWGRKESDTTERLNNSNSDDGLMVLNPEKRVGGKKMCQIVGNINYKDESDKRRKWKYDSGEMLW